MNGKHIELFPVEGTPGALTTAEISGWTGHVLSGPRSDLANIVKRAEANRNSAYLLLGDDDEAVGGVLCHNGRTAWMWSGGTYADWENRGLDE